MTYNTEKDGFQLTDNSRPLKRAGVIDMEEQCWQFRFSRETVTPPVNVALLRQGTFFVTNSGSSCIKITQETSADAHEWVEDNQKILASGQTAAMVGKYYGKYYRLRLQTAWLGNAAVKFIAQFYNRSDTE